MRRSRGCVGIDAFCGLSSAEIGRSSTCPRSLAASQRVGEPTVAFPPARPGQAGHLSSVRALSALYAAAVAGGLHRMLRAALSGQLRYASL